MAFHMSEYNFFDGVTHVIPALMECSTKCLNTHAIFKPEDATNLTHNYLKLLIILA